MNGGWFLKITSFRSRGFRSQKSIDRPVSIFVFAFPAKRPRHALGNFRRHSAASASRRPPPVPPCARCIDQPTSLIRSAPPLLAERAGTLKTCDGRLDAYTAHTVTVSPASRQKLHKKGYPNHATTKNTVKFLTERLYNTKKKKFKDVLIYLNLRFSVLFGVVLRFGFSSAFQCHNNPNPYKGISDCFRTSAGFWSSNSAKWIPGQWWSLIDWSDKLSAAARAVLLYL